MRHLTDEEIQAHLDGSDLDPGLRDHLGTCTQCREVLGAYRALYADLADDVGFEMPLDLAGTVTSRLGLKQTARRLQVTGDVVLVACSIVVMLIGVSVFADLSPLCEAVSAFAGPILEYAAPHLESARGGIMNVSRPLTVPVAGFAILTIMWALDMAFKHRRPTLAGRGR